MSAGWHLAALIVAAVPLIGHGAEPPIDANATVVSAVQIEQQLQTPGKTRGFVVLGAQAETKRMIDLNIPFKFNSSELQPQATAQLRQLQSALTSQSLRSDRFMVAGHTDGNGSAQYNQQLSVRRAEVVKRYLVEHGVDAERLDAVGYGAQHLALPDRPEDPSNRRVEIRNLGEQP